VSNGYDVHFLLSGFYHIEAATEEEAREITREILQTRIAAIEGVLATGIGIETTDVVES
jgi:VIT1/CCC1 family predicted Fe2+/Mn2+ transporter